MDRGKEDGGDWPIGTKSWVIRVMSSGILLHNKTATKLTIMSHILQNN
jgi:hypothetical protein